MAAGGDGFDGYVEDTVDPGPWLLLGTTVFCFGVMLIIVPILVRCTVYRRKRQSPGLLLAEKGSSSDDDVSIGWRDILLWDKEWKKLLKLAIPYSTSAFASSAFSNACLILISQRIGTHAAAAYALVQVLVGLTDGVLYGPLYACTSLCAQAVGAGNSWLAGNYIQLSILLYGIMYIPVVFFWWFMMYDIILFLEWGEETTAALAQSFIRVYIWSYILGGISSAVWQLLEVTGKAVHGTVISILWGAANLAIMSYATVRYEHNVDLITVAWIYNATSLIFIMGTLVLAQLCGWLTPFNKGLFRSFSLWNFPAIGLMLQQAIPLSMGSLLSNAEWTVLTLFASVLGPAEVAAWALLGSIWDVFYAVTSGVGDAAEIRLARHLGENSPRQAQCAAYKSLLLGMVIATGVSILYFSLQHQIPAWFTADATLQAMLQELVPFVGVANLTMTFGTLCWSLIGAQGKYKMATWISFVSSWGVSMPMAAMYVFVFRMDLQGLTSAVCIGYLSTGAALSYCVLSTDWKRRAQKIHDQNAESETNEDDGGGGDDDVEDPAEERWYASLRFRSLAARLMARRNVLLVTIPAGRRPGIVLGHLPSRRGVYVLKVRRWSPVSETIKVGDAFLVVDGVNVTKESSDEVVHRLQQSLKDDRHIAVHSRPADGEEENVVGKGDDDTEASSVEMSPTCSSTGATMIIPYSWNSSKGRNRSNRAGNWFSKLNCKK